MGLFFFWEERDIPCHHRKSDNCLHAMRLSIVCSQRFSQGENGFRNFDGRTCLRRRDPGLARCTSLPFRRFSHVLVLTLSCHRAPPVSPCHYLSKGGQASHSWLLRQRLLRRSRGVRGSADHQHGTRSLSDHVFCHTAQKHVGESRPPMRPHDNQIYPLLACDVHNRLRGSALDEEALCLEPNTLYSLSTRLQEVLRIGLQVIQISRSHSRGHLVHGHRGQVEHMEEGEPCLELLCHGNGIRQCSVCRGAKVYGDKHVLDDHGSLLQC